MSQENEPKKVYTVIATITEVEKDGNVHIKGAGKYIYEKDDKIKWLILEGASAETSKFLAETKDFVVPSAMLFKRSLRSCFSSSSSNPPFFYIGHFHFFKVTHP